MSDAFTRRDGVHKLSFKCALNDKHMQSGEYILSELRKEKKALSIVEETYTIRRHTGSLYTSRQPAAVALRQPHTGRGGDDLTKRPMGGQP